MIDFARNISKANVTMSQGKWDKKNLKGTELKGKTVGIIGLGRIGAEVAKRCQSFGMETIAYDKFIPQRRAENLGVQLVKDLDQLLTKSDYITIHLPLTPQTKNMINKDNISILKKEAVIVNTGRGGIINEEALYNALKNNQIRGACIDVYTEEPASMEKFPFIGLENCITTPHLGASTKEAQINVAKLAAEHIAQALNSNIFIDAVNIPFKLSEDLVDIYRPYMELGAGLGRFISQFNDGTIFEVAIRYKGDIFSDFEPIKAVTLHSIFDERLTDAEPVTYMNIDKVLSENGIHVKIEKYEKPINFENIIKVYIKTEDGKRTKIAGTVFSEQPKIVEIDGIFFDFAPSDNMLILKNKDIPGVVGKVGTLLGTLGINIAALQLGRMEEGGNALSVIAIDDPISPEGLDKLKKLEQILDATRISL
jgi:D-3-phosphoglycerate dehydrogenase